MYPVSKEKDIGQKNKIHLIHNKYFFSFGLKDDYLYCSHLKCFS